MKKLYLMITKDRYELPMAVASSVQELARMTGYNANNISSSISKRNKTGRKTSFICVEVEE